jgi:polyisoprenoid-binding protein YceI
MKSFPKFVFLQIMTVVFFLVSAQALADVPSYKVIKEKSSLKFIAIQNNAPVEGRFKDFTADIRFDPQHPEVSSISVEVDINSLSINSEDVLKTVKMPEWLSAELFPKATFLSSKITRMPGSDNYYANGDLTIRGKKVPVILNFFMEHFDDKSAVATGSISLDRKDFAVGQGEWSRDDVVKNEVRVQFRIAAEKQ